MRFYSVSMSQDILHMLPGHNPKEHHPESIIEMALTEVLLIKKSR